MPATSLQQLFVEQLRDMYDGEKRLVRVLPKMAKAATSNQLQAAFTMHAKETAKQVRRLEQVFRTMGETPRGKKCDGILGIVEEGNRAIQELDGPVLDAALIAGAQKVEHYEIAGYGTLAYFAELLGQDKAQDLLGQTLDEEKATDEKLTALAKSDVNRDALVATGEETEDGSEAATSRLMRNVRRAAKSLGFGNQSKRQRRTSSRKNSGRRKSRSKRSGR